jgi:N-methylhydantoinase A
MLLPFGGAGGVHAAAVASELGMRRILVPPQPGAFSALGLLCTDVVHDYMRSELRPLAELSAAHAEQIFQELEKKARGELDAEGMDSRAGSFARELDLRYSGQGYELRIPLAGLLEGEIAPATLSAIRERFDTRHAELHGHAARERPVEVVSYRLRLRLPVPKYEPRKAAPAASEQRAEHAVKGKRSVWFFGATVQATLYDRARLPIGAMLDGPAVVEQFDATTVVPLGWRGHVDAYRNLILTAT